MNIEKMNIEGINIEGMNIEGMRRDDDALGGVEKLEMSR